MLWVFGILSVVLLFVFFWLALCLQITYLDENKPQFIRSYILATAMQILTSISFIHFAYLLNHTILTAVISAVCLFILVQVKIWFEYHLNFIAIPRDLEKLSATETDESK